MSAVEKMFKGVEGAEVVKVTPELARRLIEKSNYGNRKVRTGVVKKYAKIMKNGDWRFSPETISISKSGRLLNGQHRMLAVIESGITCRFLFATGFEDEVFSVLDRGAVRSRADALKIDRKLTECATLLYRMATKENASLVTDDDVARASLCIEETHAYLMDFCRTSSRVFSSAPFRLAAVARINSGSDKNYVLDLYRNLVLSHTEVLPPIGHAVVRAVLTGRLFSGGSTSQFSNCCVAWDLFNPKSSHKSKIVISYREQVATEIAQGAGYDCP